MIYDEELLLDNFNEGLAENFEVALDEDKAFGEWITSLCHDPRDEQLLENTYDFVYEKIHEKALESGCTEIRELVKSVFEVEFEGEGPWTKKYI